MASSGADVVSRVRQAVSGALDRYDWLARQGAINDPPMVVAVSGGADSLCLLDALVAVVTRAEKRLLVGHVDHQLRPESAADAEHVRRVGRDLGVKVSVDTVDVRGLAQAERIGIEEAARLARYRSLARFADDWLTDIALTGHTRDDSIETVVLHFLRGTGARGLSGISEQEWLPSSWLGPTPGLPVGFCVYRPLLQVGRADTVAYCEARGISWITDASNADPQFTRNRVRGHLLPVLRTYNPAIDRALVRMAQVMRDEDALMDDLASTRWSDIDVWPAVDVALTLEGWQQSPVAVQRRLVRRIASTLGHEEIGFDAVERALAVGHNDGPRRAELGHGLTVERRHDTLVFRMNRQIDRGGDQHA